MTKRETQDAAKVEAAIFLDVVKLPQIDSNVWIYESNYGQVKITLTAVNKQINIDDAVADYGIKRDKKNEKEE